jgi:cyclase
MAAVLRELADGVYAYIQPPGGWCVSNAGVIVDDARAVVIDTLATQARAGRLQAQVDRLQPAPARIVVNTHHHGDHIFGNHLYGPAATIVAHDRAPAEMTETGLALTQLWPAVEWGDVQVTLPTLTFSDRLTLRLNDRTAELIHVGPAHTTNDIVVWLPAEKILFAGDVALSGSAQFVLMGSLSGSLTALARLRELGAETIVCGHGAVAGPEVLDDNLRYLEWVAALAAEGHARGETPLQTARQADRRGFAHLLDGERLVGNLHRAFAELDGAEPGRPVDVLAAFGEMVEDNDGLLPTSLA